MATKLIISQAYFIACCFLIIILVTYIKATNDTLQYRESVIGDDLPGIGDIKKYLTKLDKIVSFANLRRPYVDATLFTGIFFINVNLINTIKRKGRRLRPQKRRRFQRLIETTDDIMTYFSKMSQLDRYNKSPFNLERLFFNFVNNSAWPDQLQSFNLNLLKKTKFYSQKQLTKIYYKWSVYNNMVYDINNYNPTPEQSDNCLTQLAQNPINDDEQLTSCNIGEDCVRMALNGTDFGYGITQRLLLVSLARLSFGCTFISTYEDQDLIDELCAKMYNEAEFIAYHQFMLPHIIMEQATLCSLHGHAQFLRRSWINELLDFQTPVGCFSLVRFNEEHITKTQTTIESISWRLNIPSSITMAKSCNIFATAFAGAMLSAAIRLIMEMA